jgi:predicted TIM-barrel fold metal-dependent hydrolase
MAVRNDSSPKKIMLASGMRGGTCRAGGLNVVRLGLTLSPVSYNHAMNRRSFLGVAAGMALADRAAPAAAPIPIIDTHIHLFDPFRPGGAPWPSANNPDHKVMYMTTLPSRYRPIAEPLGIVGAIAVECSGLLEDNQWVLDVAEKEDIMVGHVGRLTPGTPEFRPNLERFHKNPLYRGIRYGLGRPFPAGRGPGGGRGGNPPGGVPRGGPGGGAPGEAGRGGQPEVDQLTRPEFIADLKALADADLVMDTANPNVTLLANVVRVSDAVPNLRIVIDHLPQMEPPTEPAARASYDASMKAFRDRPQVYVKVSEVLRRLPDKSIPTDLAFYRPRLDEILDVFGIDRVLYGSDWPNGDQWLPVPVGFKIVQEYFAAKGREASEKYFWRNSVKCYKWVKRTAKQPQV